MSSQRGRKRQGWSRTKRVRFIGAVFGVLAFSAMLYARVNE